MGLASPAREREDAEPRTSRGRSRAPGRTRRPEQASARTAVAGRPRTAVPGPRPLTPTGVSASGEQVETHAAAVAHAVARGGTAPPAQVAAAMAAPGRGLPPVVHGVLARPDAGLPLPPVIRERVEPHLGVDLRAARVVSGPVAAVAAASLDARAFTADSTIVLGQGQSAYDSRLMAHEATHVAQQAAGGFAVHRATIMREASSGFPPPLPSWSDVVGAVVPDAVKDEVLGLIRRIPGYTLLTLITGVDPLSGAPAHVDRQALVDQLMSYGPFGAAIARTLDLLHAFEDVATLVSDSFARYGLTLGRINGDVASAWQRISVTDPSGALEIGRQTVDAILADVSRLVSDLVDRVLAMVKDAVLDVVEPLLTDDPTLGPVWRLATKVLHRDPLRGVPVDAPTVEILAGFLHLIGKDAVLEQMRERGTLQQTADWLDSQLATFLSILDEAGSLFSDAWAAIQPGNLSALPDTLPGLAQRALGLVRRVGDFATTVIGKVLELIKTSLLGLLTEHAEKIPGFRMIKVVLGRNPFTGEEFPRTAENLIGGFISLLPGGEETYAQLAESGVIADAAGRIETAMTDLGINAEMIIATFRGVWDTLSLEDLLAPVDAFERVVAKFGDPIARIVRFVSVVVQVVVELVLRLMHFPTELLAHIVSEVQQTVEDVRKDPVGFLKNMFEALKRGILGFFDRIGGYLIEGLAGWLFHGLGKLGITIPKDLSFASILKLVLDVLGLSVEFLWTKLGEKIGPEKVAKVRAALDTLAGVWQFVKDVQEKGIAAIWEYVQSQLSNLWQTLLSAAMTWVTETLVKKGLAKLATFLDPTGIMAVVNSVIAVIEAINSAIEYAKEILEIIDRYVSTIAAVARGDVEPGAAMVEKGFASAIPVALGFLAPQVGLGNLPEEIAKIVGKLRAVVAQAVEWVIDQAWKLGKAAIEAVTGGGAKKAAPPDAPPKLQEAAQAGDVVSLAATQLVSRVKQPATPKGIEQVLSQILGELGPSGLRSLALEGTPDEGLHIVGSASPKTVLADLTGHKEKKVQMVSRAKATFHPNEPDTADLGDVVPETQTTPKGEKFSFLNRPTGTGGVRGHGGAVMHPVERGVVSAVTWNSADKMSRSSNNDHAEHHLVSWLDSVKARWPYLTDIEVNNDPYSPCTECAEELEGVAREVNSSPGRGVPRLNATLTWKEVWVTKKGNGTRPDTIPKMLHWRVEPNQLPQTGDLEYDLQLSLALQDRALKLGAAAGPVKAVPPFKRSAK